METNVTLQPMMSFSKLPATVLFLTGLFFVLMVFLFVFLAKRKKKAKAKVKETPALILCNMANAKPRYIGKLTQLAEKYKSGACSTREAYLKMSDLIRSFVREATGINALNMSLSDVRGLSMPALVTLMEEYYSPEFSCEAEGDVLQSIDKTIKAIEAWK